MRPSSFVLSDFESIFAQRQAEADDFYPATQPAVLSDDERLIQRQAFAGMLWSKQFHHYYSDDFKVECPTGSGQYLLVPRGIYSCLFV